MWRSRSRCYAKCKWYGNMLWQAFEFAPFLCSIFGGGGGHLNQNRVRTEFDDYYERRGKWWPSSELRAFILRQWWWFVGGLLVAHTLCSLPSEWHFGDCNFWVVCACACACAWSGTEGRFEVHYYQLVLGMSAVEHCSIDAVWWFAKCEVVVSRRRRRRQRTVWAVVHQH